jgi:hypothetical protein
LERKVRETNIRSPCRGERKPKMKNSEAPFATASEKKTALQKRKREEPAEPAEADAGGETSGKVTKIYNNCTFNITNHTNNTNNNNGQTITNHKK